jgi:hypothetical protein
VKPKTFQAELLEGHKGCAVEVPFDPAITWSSRTVRIRVGRNGHPVAATVNGCACESFIVGRQKRHYLLVDEEVRHAARAEVGDQVKVTVRPRP